MITLNEYFALRLKRKKSYPALTALEAQMLGLKYPLERKWPKKYGPMLIPDDLLEELLKVAEEHRRKRSLSRKQRRKEKETKDYDLCLKYGWVPPKEELVVRLIKKEKEPRVFKSPPKKPIISNIAADSFLETFQWRQLRMKALKLYGPRCMCCGATPQTGAVMNVDHIKPRKLFPELALDLTNLQILCHECNHGKGNWDTTDWRGNGRL